MGLDRDFALLGQILESHLRQISDWGLKTGGREKDWTLHQTLAHLVSIAHLFNLAAEAASQNRSLQMPEFKSRHDLAAWNAGQIAELEQEEPAYLMASLQMQFEMAQEMWAKYADKFEQPIFLPPYQRQATLLDCIEWQFSHAGVIHAAQLTRPLNLPPLWEQYPLDFAHRVAGRFLRHLSLAYWYEYGREESRIINMAFGGQVWHLVASPASYAAVGAHPEASYHLQFADYKVLFSLFSLQMTFPQSLQSGQLVIEGDMMGALNCLKLFSATPPK